MINTRTIACLKQNMVRIRIRTLRIGLDCANTCVQCMCSRSIILMFIVVDFASEKNVHKFVHDTKGHDCRLKYD